MNYVNDGLPFLVNSQIVEYDIARGNTSVMREFKLLPEETIAHLENLSKEDRVREVGLLQRNDKLLANQLEGLFTRVVQMFMEQNNLDQDVDVLCIRRDAVFVVNKPISQPRVGNHILFRPKSTYHAALQLGPRWHFFFERGKPVKVDNFLNEKKDINGALPKLREGIMDFLSEFVDVCEGHNMNRREIYHFLNQFCTAYKERRVDICYYREFTADALYHIVSEDTETYLEDVPDYMVEDIDIGFNYRNIIVPLCQILI